MPDQKLVLVNKITPLSSQLYHEMSMNTSKEEEIEVIEVSDDDVASESDFSDEKEMFGSKEANS